MLLSKRTKEIVYSLILLSLPVIFLFPNMKDPSKLNSFDRFILKLSAPVQQSFIYMFRWGRRVWSDYIYLVDVKHENDRLRLENSVLRANNAILEIWAQRGKEVEALLGFKEERPSEMIAARVVSRSLSPYYRVVRLRVDRGKGVVHVNDPVVTPAGVVGKISRVYDDYADVLLAVDPHVKIPVVVKRTGAEALLVGLGDDKRYLAMLTYLRKEEEVKPGDLVVTSGLGGVEGVRYPPDLPVGRVVEVKRNPKQRFQTAVVESTVDFARIDKVLVVVVPPPPSSDRPSAERQRSLPRAGLSF